jgi:hypothetical protein
MAFATSSSKNRSKTNVHSSLTSHDLTPSSKNSYNTFLTPKYEPKFKFSLNNNTLIPLKKKMCRTINYNTVNNNCLEVKDKIDKIVIEKNDIIVLKHNPNSINNIQSPLPRSSSVSNELSSSLNSTYVVNQAEIGLREFVKCNKLKFIERLCKGPPESFRWTSWMISAGIELDRSEELYYNLLNQEIDPQTDLQIKKDLNRTVTDEKLFSVDTTKSTLYNVLRAYSNCDKEVSYCQGMNFIVAFLLIVSDFNEVDTLYMMMFLFMFNKSNLGIRGFFMDNFPLLNLYTYQFEYLFEKHFPSLKKHFDDLDIPKELWISKWIQTLFTICLPLDVLIRLWDCIFAKGLEFLFNFSLALIKEIEPDLKKFNDISDISEYFKTLNPYCNNTSGKNLKIEVEVLIKDALSIKVSKNLLNNLKTEYETKFNVDLSIFNVNYDLKSLYNSTNSNKDNIEIFENENFSHTKPFLNPIKIDLKSKFKIKSEDIIQEEEARRSTIDVKLYQTNTNLDIMAEDFEDENCSEFDLCNVDIVNNVKTHTLNTKSLEEEKKKRILEQKITNINEI